MTNARTPREVLIIAVIVIAWLAMPAAVFLTGGTFGQRCARAFPKDGAAQERCIYAMSKGERP